MFISLYSFRTRYTAEAGHTLPGRPMPFVLWNVSDVTLKKFFIIDPPLWSLNIMNGTDVWVDELYCNATATRANASQNWVQNTDGFGKVTESGIQYTRFELTSPRYDGLEEHSPDQLRLSR
jgi:galacturan 1,4-alpha-galacturonidase